MVLSLKTTVISLVLLSNLNGLPDSGNGELTCLRGGMAGVTCSSNCPPCWKKVSATVYHCFEYESGQKCQYDWTDIKKNPIGSSQGQEKSKSKGATRSVEIENPSEPTEIEEDSSSKGSSGTKEVVVGSSTVTIIQTVKRSSSAKNSSRNGADESRASKIIPLSVIGLAALIALQFTI